MPTSGTTAWELTANDAVTQALSELAVTELGEDPQAEEMTFGLFHLNALLKSWQNLSYLETTGTVTIPADTESGTLSADIQEVISARYAGDFDRWLHRYNRDEYLAIPNKDASGEPTIFYVSNQRDATVMYVWPVPTAETTIKIDYRRKPDTVTAASETIDFPEEYQGALIANLAVRLAGRFGDGIPQRTFAELKERAERLRIEMEDLERPASYNLGPW